MGTWKRGLRGAVPLDIELPRSSGRASRLPRGRGQRTARNKCAVAHGLRRGHPPFDVSAQRRILQGRMSCEPAPKPSGNS
jgi:hypothetical protein